MADRKPRLKNAINFLVIRNSHSHFSFVLWYFFSSILLFLGCTKAIHENDRPNIIFIMSDDHAYQAINAYSDELIQTPNIDRLAKEGAIFKRATVTNSICAPSRAIILTGKHSFLNGKEDNVQPFDWDQPNFPKLMQTNGYQTAIIGKIPSPLVCNEGWAVSHL